MNERDYQIVLRAKRQIRREIAWRSFLIFGLLFSAALRFMGVEFRFLYISLFIFFFISLVLSSDLIANFGRVSKQDLINIIDSHIHNNPEELTKFSSLKNK